MSVLSEIFSSSGSSPADISALEADARRRQAAYAAEQEALKGTQYSQAAASVAEPPPPPPPTPTGGPDVALQKLNEALGSGFESRYLPDTLDDPFVSESVGAGRGKADEFIANMLRRGTLTESGRAGAVSAIESQVPTATSRLSGISSALLDADRGKLTGLANTYRGTAQQVPLGTEFDPTPYVNSIASTGQGLAGSFGERFNASLPAGDLFDVSGLAGAGGGVTRPQNTQYDPYAVEGGKLTTGLDEGGAPPPSKKRSTSVF